MPPGIPAGGISIPGSIGIPPMSDPQQPADIGIEPYCIPQPGLPQVRRPQPLLHRGAQQLGPRPQPLPQWLPNSGQPASLGSVLVNTCSPATTAAQIIRRVMIFPLQIVFGLFRIGRSQRSASSLANVPCDLQSGCDVPPTLFHLASPLTTQLTRHGRQTNMTSLCQPARFDKPSAAY